jgi:ABC-type transport system involved in multi-copper enzyme maturation permease subunit
MGTTIAWLRGLSPLGPIFGKELRVTARRKRTYVLRVLYLGALLLIMLFFFSVVYMDRSGSSITRKAQQMAEMGATFFGIFAFFTLTSMALVGPVLTATAVNAERMHKTLAVLLMTPITAWQIVAGKLFSRLWIALTLIGLSLPALAVVRLLGGVEAEQIFAVLSLCVATVMATAAVGLLFSILMSRAYSVILLSYGLLFFFYALVPFLFGLILFEVLNVSNRGGEQLFFNWMSVSNPFFAMALVAIPEVPPFGIFSWWWCVGSHLGFAAVLVMLCGVLLRRMARKENEGSGTAAPAFGVVVPALAAEVGALETRPACGAAKQGSNAQRTVSDNPVLWREVRRPLLARRWQAIAMSLFLVAVLGVIYCALAAGNDLDDADAQMGFACVFCGLMTLVICVLSATAIAQEKEGDTWTLLVATPLSARQIVWGKLAGLLRRLAWPSALIVGHFLIFTLAGVINWTMLWVILWMTFATNAVWLALGLYYSLRLKTVTFAVILNLLGPVVAYGGVAMVLGIAGVVIDRSEKWVEVVGLYAPYGYMVQAIDGLGARNYSNGGYNYYAGQFVQSDRQVWMPVVGRIGVSEFLLLTFVVGAGHLMVSYVIVWYTMRRFDGMVGRASQREVLGKGE